MKSYICKSCGAELLINDEATFTTCLYCNNNIAITDKEIDSLNIKKIIPFDVDKEEIIKICNSIFAENIKDAKKVYVPVRFCNYEFDYLIYYEYVYYSTENNDKYRTTEQLIDGKVENEIVFSNSKIKNVIMPNELRSAERLDFDPVLLKDVSIEYSNINDMEEIKNNINYDILNYSRSVLARKINRVFSSNHFVTGVEIEPFTTLIPVYILKTNRGVIYNLPGVRPKTLEKKRLNRIIAFFCSLFCIWSLGMYLFFTKGSSSGSDPKLIAILIGIGVLVSAVFYSVIMNSSVFLRKQYDNFSHSIYTYGKKRKRLK